MRMIRKTALVLLLCLLSLSAFSHEEKDKKSAQSTTSSDDLPSISPEEAMKRLAEGNARFRKNQPSHPRQNMARVNETSKGQHPFAVVLTCSDSRVSPEIIFDQGLGDLFEVRVAGNVLNDQALGSIEYAISHLGPRLILVLGHEKCGAVQATLDGEKIPGHLQNVAKSIQPAIKDSLCEKGDKLQCAVRANVRYVVDALNKKPPIISKMVEDEDIVVVGGVYDIETGKVKILKSEIEL